MTADRESLDGRMTICFYNNGVQYSIPGIWLVGWTTGARARGEYAGIDAAIKWWAYQCQLEALETGRPCDQCSACKRGQECPNAFT